MRAASPRRSQPGTLRGWAPGGRLDAGAFDFSRSVRSGGFDFALAKASSRLDEAAMEEAELARTRAELEGDWRAWLEAMFPEHVASGFAEHHETHWGWVWDLKRGERPPALLDVWARGGAKSTSAEMACVAVGALNKRTYGLYICATQDQANDHVQNVGDMLISEHVERFYPRLADRKVTKYGVSAGWKRNRLRTDAGFTIDAVGLDRGFRGLKLEEQRPDFMVFDDLDEESDTERTTEKKVQGITRKAIPAGSRDLAVLVAQNLVIPDGVVSQLVDGRAKFLAKRSVNGPVPAVYDLEYEEHSGGVIEITGGRPSWQGQDLKTCADLATDIGIDAFLAEAQHRMDVYGRPPFLREWWAEGRNRFDPTDPKLARLAYGRFFAWDTANKDDPDNAYTVGIVGEVTRDYRLMIREVLRGRKEFDELPDWVVDWLRRHARDLKLKGGWAEDAASGTQLLQVIAKTGPAWLRNVFWPASPRGSKEDRWAGASIWCRRDCVLLPHPHESVNNWLPEFEEELFALRPKFVDQRDAFSILINMCEAPYDPDKGLYGLGGLLSTGWVGRRAAGRGVPQRKAGG